MHTLPVLALLAWLPLAGAAVAQDVKGSLTANGKSATLAHAVAFEVDSSTEKGYMDVVVVLSDRKLAAAQARDVEKLERMMRDEGLVALVVRLNPDAKVMSASPLHPAMRTIIASAAFVRWQPRAFDERRVAGRFWTEGTQKEFGQQWSYDATFETTIALDPAAKTAPKK